VINRKREGRSAGVDKGDKMRDVRDVDQGTLYGEL